MKDAKTKTKNELLPGTLEMLILKTLSIESMHGYGIAQHIQMLSADVLTMKRDRCIRRCSGCWSSDGCWPSGRFRRTTGARASTR